MNILQRMESPSSSEPIATPSRPSSARRRLGAVVAQVGLAGAGAIHLAWAAGVNWPTDSRDGLADLVVGARPFPSGPVTLGVVGLIALGSGLVARETSRAETQSDASDGSSSTPLDRALRVAAYGVPSVLALRGVGGLIASAFELGQATDVFRHWDLRIYSPLCIVLALAAVAAMLPDRDPGRTVVESGSLGKVDLTTLH